MPEKTLRVWASPTSSVKRSSLVEPSTGSQLTMQAMRRSIFAKSSMVMVGASASPPGVAMAACLRHGWLRCLKQCIKLRGIDALHEVLVTANGVARPQYS